MTLDRIQSIDGTDYMVGLYSAVSASKNDTYTYQMITGESKRVTAIYKSKETKGYIKNFPDTVNYGPVHKYIKTHENRCYRKN